MPAELLESDRCAAGLGRVGRDLHEGRLLELGLGSGFGSGLGLDKGPTLTLTLTLTFTRRHSEEGGGYAPTAGSPPRPRAWRSDCGHGAPWVWSDSSQGDGAADSPVCSPGYPSPSPGPDPNPNPNPNANPNANLHLLQLLLAEVHILGHRAQREFVRATQHERGGVLLEFECALCSVSGQGAAHFGFRVWTPGETDREPAQYYFSA